MSRNPSPDPSAKRGGEKSLAPPSLAGKGAGGLGFPQLWAGDIVLSRNMTRASRWIRAGGILASGDCRVSHASLALGDQARQPEVIESLWRVTRTPWENYRGQELVVWRHRWLSTGDRKEIVNAALGEIDQAYGGLKLLLFGLDTLCGTSWFTRRLGISHLKVCSNLIAWSYDRGVPFLGPWFGQPWRSVSPDTIDDWCRCHTEDWIEVYSSINGHARKAA